MQPPHMRSRAAGARRERGQTIALVAVTMVSVLAMAALTIDLTTLYVAHGEIQRAADAAGLAQPEVRQYGHLGRLPPAIIRVPLASP